jgi:hypothetical protein
MVRGLVTALLLVACDARNPVFCPGGEDDRGECIVLDPDAAGVACYGMEPFAVCVPGPQQARTLVRVDSTAGCDDLVMVGGRELCVVKGTDVDITQRIAIAGARPVVIFASNALTVGTGGIVDAAGTTTSGGPGVDLACDANATAGKDNASGGGGGAGGSFGSRGGAGGNGDGAQGTGGGAGAPVARPPALVGGCSGTDGGAGTGGRGGDRGFGGGGIYLIAGRTLSIRGTITASGAGGRGGGVPRSGGGGGGSGGMIMLYAPTVTVAPGSRIFANGGGGGGGAKVNQAGIDGATPTEPQLPAKGGTGLGSGGDGGDGAFLTNAAGAGAPANEGGGGGGGGAGVIYVLGGDVSAANVSPPRT